MYLLQCDLDFETVEASSLLASALAARAQQCAAGDQEVTTAAMKVEIIMMMILEFFNLNFNRYCNEYLNSVLRLK